MLKRTADAAAKANDEDIDTPVNDVIDALSEMTQTDGVAGKAATTQTDGGLSLRELEGLDKALKSIRGEKALLESIKSFSPAGT